MADCQPGFLFHELSQSFLPHMIVEEPERGQSLRYKLRSLSECIREGKSGVVVALAAKLFGEITQFCV